MVDFVLVGVLVIAVCVALLQLALGLHVRNVLTDAAGEGARRAALVGGTEGEAAERVAMLTDAAPAYVALYQATRNVIDVKVSLEYARSLAPPDDKVVRAYQGEMRRMADELLLQCRNEGIIRQDVDLDWARIMFYALVHEATGTKSSSSTGQESDRLTRLVVDSLLHGVGSGHPHQQETGSHVEGAPIRQSRG